MTEKLNQTCRSAYAQVKTFYDLQDIQIDGERLGFRVLYGPPVLRAKILFVGFQPGGRLAAAQAGEADGEMMHWPDALDYLSSDWPLARRIRQIWPKHVLEQSVGTNAIFFRAPSLQHWYKLPKPQRKEAEEFCVRILGTLIDAINPRLIIVIGLKAFDLLTSGTACLTGRNGRRLIKHGTLRGHKTLGIIHLSGARINDEEISLIREYTRNCSC